MNLKTRYISNKLSTILSRIICALYTFRIDIFCFLRLLKELLKIGVYIIRLIFTLNRFTLDLYNKSIKESKYNIEILLIVIPMSYIVFFFIWLPLRWDSLQLLALHLDSLLLMNDNNISGMNDNLPQSESSPNNTPNNNRPDPMKIQSLLNPKRDEENNNNQILQASQIQTYNDGNQTPQVSQTQAYINDDSRPLTQQEKLLRIDVQRRIN